MLPDLYSFWGDVALPVGDDYRFGEIQSSITLVCYKCISSIGGKFWSQRDSESKVPHLEDKYIMGACWLFKYLRTRRTIVMKESWCQSIKLHPQLLKECPLRVRGHHQLSFLLIHVLALYKHIIDWAFFWFTCLRSTSTPIPYSK